MRIRLKTFLLLCLICLRFGTWGKESGRVLLATLYARGEVITFLSLDEKVERRKRTITVKETETLLAVKLKSEERRHGWCTECAAEVTWIELPTVDLIHFFGSAVQCQVHLSDRRMCSRSLTAYLSELNRRMGHETP